MRLLLNEESRKNRFQGSLTVWCVLTLLPGAVLFLSLLMVCRFHIERNDAGRITHLSGKAALTFYDGPLCDRYGLYGTEGTGIEKKALFFLHQNQGKDYLFLYRNPLFLLSPMKPFPSLFHYEINQVSVQPGNSLSNQGVFLKQVREVMRYRVLGELVSFLNEQIKEIEENQHQHGSLETSYAVIQQELSQYYQLYERLSRTLFSEGFYLGVDGVFTEKTADPERIIHLLENLSSGSDTDRTEVLVRLKWWQEHHRFLVQRNEEGIAFCSELEEVIQRLKKEIQDFQQIAGKLSEGEREQDQIKNMIQSVAKLDKDLWGMKGETASMIRGLTDNLAILKGLNEMLSPVVQQLTSLTNVNIQDCFALKSVFQQFSEYTGTFKMKKAEKSNSFLDFLGVSQWLKGFYVDLSGFAPDQDLMEEEGNSFSWMDPFSLQQQISSQMDFFQLPVRSFGEQLEDQVYLCEYGICAFRNLSDTIKEAEGVWPSDFFGNLFGKTMLKNETEYLIHGSWNEFRNVNDVQIKIIALRTIMNMAFLFSNPEKNAVIHSLSDPVNLVIPVIGGVVVYTAAVVTWSIAEAYLDYNALILGESIPLWKTNETWQSDLKGIMKKTSSSMKLRLSKEDKEKSKLEKILTMDYEMYLRILLLFTPQEDLISRMQSLIDLNLRQDGNRSFSLSNMVTDFSMTVEMRGRYGTYDQNEIFAYYP